MKRNLIVISVILAFFGAGAAYLVLRGTKLPEHPLDRVPKDAEMALYVNVPAVVDSTLWKAIVVDRGEDRPLLALEERCGFDPLASLENVTTFVTGGADVLEHVGFIAEGDFDHEALAGCLRSAVTEDGGAIKEVEIEGARGIASATGEGSAAFIGRRGIIAGNEATVGDAVRAVAGRDATFGDDPAVRALWDRLAQGREIVGIASIPDGWQQTLDSWLGAGRAAAFTPHIGDLVQLGIGLRVSRGFGMTLVATSESDEAARTLADKLRGALERFSGNPFIMMSPAGTLIRELGAQANGKETTIALDVTEEKLDGILRFVKQLTNLLEPRDLDAVSDADAPAVPAAAEVPSGAATPASTAPADTAPSTAPAAAPSAP